MGYISEKVFHYLIILRHKVVYRLEIRGVLG